MENKLVFDTNNLDPEIVIETIRTHGVALIKNALPSANYSQWVTAMLNFRQDLDVRGDVEKIKWIQLNGIAGSHIPEALVSILLCISQSPLIHIMDAYLGSSEIVVPWNHFLFRLRDKGAVQALQDSGFKHTFHQDHDHIPGAFPLNVWIPLVPIDDNCQGLSFAFPPTDKIFPAPFNLDDYIKQNQGWIWSPSLAVGDCLLFHRPTIHGIFAESEKPSTRISAEFRCGKKHDVPQGYENDIIELNRLNKL